MRHIMISLLLIALCLGFSVVSSNAVRTACADTNALLEQAQASAREGDYDAVRTWLARADKTWSRREGFFGVVLRHEEADDVLRDFAALHEYARCEDEDDFFATCASVMATIEHISGMTRASYHNILSAAVSICA